MAKDPAFLFYPGDASEDTQFMNRLERGCYFDIMKAQKRFGKFSYEQIKKVLGQDFESCWPAVEPTLEKEVIKTSSTSDEQQTFYFIGWVAEKIEERKKFSESRSNNRKSKKSLTSEQHMLNKSSTLVKHMVDEDEIEDEVKDDTKEESVRETISRETDFVEIGEPNGNRISIRTKYAGEKPIIVHNLEEFFKQQNQLADIQRAGWLDFDGFMKQNPGAMFDDTDHVYNSFRKYSLKPKEQNAVTKTVTQLNNLNNLIDAKFAAKKSG